MWYPQMTPSPMKVEHKFEHWKHFLCFSSQGRIHSEIHKCNCWKLAWYANNKVKVSNVTLMTTHFVHLSLHCKLMQMPIKIQRKIQKVISHEQCNVEYWHGENKIQYKYKNTSKANTNLFCQFKWWAMWLTTSNCGRYHYSANKIYSA